MVNGLDIHKRTKKETVLQLHSLQGFLKFLYSEPVITKEKNGAKDTMTLLQITIKYIGSSIYYKWQKILNFPWFFAYDIQLYWFNKIKGNTITIKLNGCNAVHIAIMYKRTEYIKTLLQKAEEESYGKDRVILLFNKDTIQEKTEYEGFNAMDLAYVDTITNNKMVIMDEEGYNMDNQINNLEKTNLNMLLLLHNNGCYFLKYKHRQYTWTRLVSLLTKWKELQKQKKPAYLKFFIEKQIQEKFQEIKNILAIFKANHDIDTDSVYAKQQEIIKAVQAKRNTTETSYQEMKSLYLKF